MFFLFPLGVGEARVRIPIVAAAIALLCLLAFVPTWVLTKDPLNRERTVEALQYWSEHPWLELDRDFVSTTLGHKAVAEIDAAVKAHRDELEHARPGGPIEVGQQVRLDRLIAVALDRETPLRRFSLVPARGSAQPGWFTAMFLHFGWLHLLGNLFFLWLCAPLLEDAWGRRLFAVIYVASGVVACVAHFLIDPGSSTSMAGASGAIAGLMGAFAVRFPLRKIAVGYFLFLGVKLWRGIWHWPAWFAAALWFADQAWDYFMGETGGVAVGAHLGGFAFGAVIALGMKGAGLDRTLTTTDESATDLSRRYVSPLVEQARAAIAEREFDKARTLLDKALVADPNDSDARVMLAGLELVTPGHDKLAGQQFVRALMSAQAESALHAVTLWNEHGMRFGTDALSPMQAIKLAQVVDQAEEPLCRGSLRLYERGADAPGVAGARAGLEAARRFQRDANDPAAARAMLERVLKVEGLPEALAGEARAQLETLPAAETTSGLDLADWRRAPAAVTAFEQPGPVEPAPVEAPPVETVTVKAVTAEHLVLASPKAEYQLPLGAIEAVAAAVVPIGNTKALVVDLFSGVAPPLRLVSTTANLQAHRTAANAKELYRSFLLELLSRGSKPLFDASRLEQGAFPVAESLDGFERATQAQRAQR